MTDLATVDPTPDRSTWGNSRAAAPVAGVRTLPELMGAYDALPAQLRGALGAAVVQWSPILVLVQWRKLRDLHGAAAATRALVEVIARNEVVELDRFAQDHLQATGRPLPHAAAGASPQRPQWGVRRAKRVHSHHREV